MSEAIISAVQSAVAEERVGRILSMSRLRQMSIHDLLLTAYVIGFSDAVEGDEADAAVWPDSDGPLYAGCAA